MKLKKSTTEYVVLVNSKGRKTGLAEKMKAHEDGILHRAFSIFIFNEKGEMLLQQRAASKYHFGKLWSNACCSHPRPGEKVKSAADRRLHEELGIAAPLKLIKNVTYSFHDKKSGLTEHEFDHIFMGIYSGAINMNPLEVMAVRWLNIQELKKQLVRQPDEFTPWFKHIMEQHADDIVNRITIM